MTDHLERYDPPAIERHWQRVWSETGIYQTDLESAPRPFYNLMMFPYPSAEGLHVGNLYAYTGSDIFGRFMAMRGFDVFEPIGFDAFGIHSENFAIQRNIHPRVLTANNVERFRETQLKRSGNRFDWSHEINSTDPAYYRWTQWVFLQLFDAGLAVRRTAPVNWCPSDRTVLADEQVINGRCERCDSAVEQRELEQWFLRITEYAERLLRNLDQLDWSEIVKHAQRAWIGRSEGTRFSMHVDGSAELQIEVFTTRPDTIAGMTYVVLAPEHALVDTVTTPEQRAAVQAYLQTTRSRSELERQQSRHKTGVFSGAYAINPYNDERVPIWIADYVLGSYGTGAIMAVPAYDERDREFAEAFDLPIREVDLLPDDEAQKVGSRTVQYRLRDWLISRQRYWGTPIPIVYCDACGVQPVPESDLPVLLPDVEDWLPRGTGRSPLAEVESFVRTVCPKCGGPARRETDVCDNFLDSAWYFLRYPSTSRSDVPLDPELTRKWLPVDMYVGGAEHSVLHLLYSRFIGLALHDLGHLPFDEPFKKFRANGMLMKDGAKMAKSRGNVVNPDVYFARHGADSLRMYLMFLGPLERGGDWTDKGFGGIRRFLGRVWDLCVQHAQNLDPDEAPSDRRRVLHRAIRQVSVELEQLRYNTAIAALMAYSNTLQVNTRLHLEEVRGLLLMLAPLAPHITEELWHRLGLPYSIHQQRFPEASEAVLHSDVVRVVVQVDGRVRGTVELSAGASEAEALEAALQLAEVRRRINGTRPAQVVYVPSRVINLVSGAQRTTP